MIIDISKFVDFKRWSDFLNHSLNKSEEWTSHVTNGGKDNGIRGYSITIPAELGLLYNKPLFLKTTIPEDTRKEMRDWMTKHSNQDFSNIRVIKIFEKLLDMSGE